MTDAPKSNLMHSVVAFVTKNRDLHYFFKLRKQGKIQTQGEKRLMVRDFTSVLTVFEKKRHKRNTFPTIRNARNFQGRRFISFYRSICPSNKNISNMSVGNKPPLAGFLPRNSFQLTYFGEKHKQCHPLGGEKKTGFSLLFLLCL